MVRASLGRRAKRRGVVSACAITTLLLGGHARVAFAAAPTASTRPASSIDERSATLNGLVNPGGLELSDCSFVYAAKDGPAQSTPCAQVDVSGFAATPVSAEVAGLQPNTGYEFALVVDNAEGMSEGEEQSFSTTSAPLAPLVMTSFANVGPTAATLHGSVSPNGSALNYCRFEYGTTAYEFAVPCATPVEPGSGETPVYAETGVLEVGTAYHFRLAAENAGGVSYGSDGSFTSLPATFYPVIPPGGCTLAGMPASCSYKPPTTSLPQVRSTPRLSAAARARAHCMKLAGRAQSQCLAALRHPYPRSMDAGLSVYHCPALTRVYASRAVAAGTSEAGWPHDECLIMDKGPAGEHHTLVGPRGVHSWLLGGYGSDTILGGNVGDVIWADYQPTGEPNHQTATIRAGNGRNVIYANDTVDYVWTGSNPKTVVHAHNPGTSGVIHCQSTRIVVFLSKVSERHFKLEGCGRISHYSVGY